MALISDAATVWSDPVTLGSEEIWQVRKGRVYLTTTASPADDDGIEMQENHAVRFPAGVIVRYRKVSQAEAVIVREAL